MADVDIDPFGEHESRQEDQEDHQLGNQTEKSKKLHLEENLKELN